MITHESLLDPISAEGLAETLGLNHGEVASVEVKSTAGSERTSLTFLEVVYAGAAAASLPTRLVLKRKPPMPPGAKKTRAREAEFYTRVAAALPSPPVVRCLAARTESDASPGYLLIEDLRATHVEPSPDDEIDFGPPVEALACIHAARWEADERVTWPRGNHTEQAIRGNLQWIAAHLPAFFDAASDALRPDERRVYERVFSSTLRPWLRPLDGRAQTLIHGDAHIGNFLLPREPGGDVYLIDWDGWQADIGARDLAFMMLVWPPDRRRRLEESVLRRYLARLEARGVRGYGWDDLWADYRRCWIRNLTIAVARHAAGRSDWRVWDHAIAAFVDLDGDELL